MLIMKFELSPYLDMARPFLVPNRYTLILMIFSLDEVLIL